MEFSAGRSDGRLSSARLLPGWGRKAACLCLSHHLTFGSPTPPYVLLYFILFFYLMFYIPTPDRLLWLSGGLQLS